MVSIASSSTGAEVESVLSAHDIHWIVTILMKDPPIVQERERLYSALGLPLGEMHDLLLNSFMQRHGTFGFLSATLKNWISKRELTPTLTDLTSILKSEKFNWVADEILKFQASGLRQLLVSGKASSKRLPKGVWFDVPDEIAKFTGREVELNTLHTNVTKSGKNERLTVITAIGGMGGIGKTSLAAKYAWEYRDDFQSNVVWINCENTNSIKDSFTRLSDHLHIDNTDSKGKLFTLEKIVVLTLAYFSDKKCLLVLDNVEDYSGIQNILPKSSTRPYVLVTSRNMVWNNKFVVLELQVFTPAESLEFLTDYLNEKSESGIELLKKLSTVLQYHPLAVRQAAAYIKVDKENSKALGRKADDEIEKYLSQFETNSKSLLNFKYWEKTGDVYEQTTYTTWNVTFQKLKRLDPLAVQIMELVSYFNPDNIPHEIFSHLTTASSTNQGDRSWWVRILQLFGFQFKSITKSEVDKAILLLFQYSMISPSRQKGTFNVHRLVQRVVRLKLYERRKAATRLEKSMRLIQAQLKSEYGRNFEESSVPHAKFILEHLKPSLNISSYKLVSRSNAIINLISDILNSPFLRNIKAGDSQFNSNSYDKALETYQLILDSLSRKEGFDHIDKSMIRIPVTLKIANTYKSMHRYEDAVEYYEDLVLEPLLGLSDVFDGHLYNKNIFDVLTLLEFLRNRNEVLCRVGRENEAIWLRHWDMWEWCEKNFYF